jgi:nitrile hydratase beta subunit
MDGIHDMGGMHGFGRVVREENEPAFHHAWEGRVLAMVRATPIPIPGGMRNNIETMDPGHYLTTSYYEKWLHARIKGLIDAGAITPEELEQKVRFFEDNPGEDVSKTVVPEVKMVATRPPSAPGKTQNEFRISPKFEIGGRIKTKNIHPAGHTRLPRYVRGKLGEVISFYGVHALQDASPPGKSRPLEPLYAVQFNGEELWGESAEPNSVVLLDMWESYLEPQ